MDVQISPYIVDKIQVDSYYTFWDMNYFLNFGQVTDRQMDGQMQSDVNEPTMHKHGCAQNRKNWRQRSHESGL